MLNQSLAFTSFRPYVFWLCCYALVRRKCKYCNITAIINCQTQKKSPFVIEAIV